MPAYGGVWSFDDGCCCGGIGDGRANYSGEKQLTL